MTREREAIKAEQRWGWGKIYEGIQYKCRKKPKTEIEAETNREDNKTEIDQAWGEG